MNGHHLRNGVRLLLAASVGLLGLVAVPDPAEAIVAPTWSQPGPWAVTVAPGDGEHTIYYATNLGQGGVDHPVVIWGNGTGATVSQYDFVLRHLASWGFVVAAANTGQSGSGQEMLAGADWIIAQNDTPGSVFHNRVDIDRIGASGHSQGGGGAITAAADPRIDTVVPIQPGPEGLPEALHSPAFYVAGQIDLIVPSLYVRLRYWLTGHVPAVFGELALTDHFISEPGRTRLLGAVTAWFRFWLFDDEAARGDFFGPSTTCGICTDPGWSSVERNRQAQAIPGPT